MSAIRRTGRASVARLGPRLALAWLVLALLSACGDVLDLAIGPGGSWPDGGSVPPAAQLVAHAGRDRFAAPGAEVVLDAGASFATDAAPLSYLWSQLEGPSVTLSNPAARRTRLRAPPEAARLVFLLTVTDGLHEATDHVTVLVGGSAGFAPFAVAGADLEVAPGATVPLDGTASWDAEGDALTYAWREIRDGAALEPFADTPRATFTAPETPGPVVLRLEVRDATLRGRDDQVIFVTPDPADRAPTLITDTPGLVDPGAAVSLVATTDDPDGDAVQVGWRQVEGPAVELAREGAGAAFDAPARLAELAFLATPSDGRLAGAPVPVVVRVTAGPDNAPPVAVLPSALEVTAGAAVRLSGAASFDPDGDALVAWAWTQLSGPTVAPEAPSEPTLAFTAPPAPCVLTFSLSVSDGVVWSAPALVRVDVVAP